MNESTASMGMMIFFTYFIKNFFCFIYDFRTDTVSRNQCDLVFHCFISSLCTTRKPQSPFLMDIVIIITHFFRLFNPLLHKSLNVLQMQINHYLISMKFYKKRSAASDAALTFLFTVMRMPVLPSPLLQ